MLVIMKVNGISNSGESVDASPQCPANSPRRILVVEDDAAIRQINAQVLAGSGYQVATAEGGTAGWDALHLNNFDLLITDYSLPGLSGLELVEKVRCARMTLPVILASGSLHTEELERHPWLQVAATLLKPVYAHQLLETVKEVLREPHDASSSPQLCDTIPGIRRW
jgi:DNA-binding response OmpR family regulator